MLDLDITRPDSKENAPVLARVSQLAYEPGEVAIVALKKEFGWDGVTVEVGNVQSLIAICREQVVVAFRGSESPLTTDGFHDWLSVVDIKLSHPDPAVADLGVAVPVFHKGFVDSLVRIWPKLSEVLAELKQKNPARSLWFTGHSLGGALAILAGAASGCPATVVTFGSPRVATLLGSVAILDKVDKRVYRFVQARDPVPHLPIISPCGRVFAQLGKCLTLEDKHFLERRFVQVILTWLTLGLYGVIWNILRKRIDYHLIENYIAAMRKM